MANDGLFFKSVAKIHTKFQVPSNSILLQCLIAVVLTLSGTFEQVLTYMGFSLGIFPIMTVIGIIKLRKDNPGAIKMAGFPFTQIIYVTTGIIILSLSFLERPVESSIAILTVMVGIPAYYIFRKNSS
jgi:APA family basic amino acid/polyamine antiporter